MLSIVSGLNHFEASHGGAVPNQIYSDVVQMIASTFSYQGKNQSQRAIHYVDEIKELTLFEL